MSEAANTDSVKCVMQTVSDNPGVNAAQLMDLLPARGRTAAHHAMWDLITDGRLLLDDERRLWVSTADNQPSVNRA